jgi:DNA-binding IclR family transcriptional regulator
MDKEDKYLMSSLYNSLELLDLLSEHKELRPIDISKLLNLSKASVFKMLYTLEKKNYVHKLVNGKYCLGLKFAHYGSIAIETHNIYDIVKPYLQRLRDEHNETTHLGILDNDLNTLFMMKESSNASIHMISSVGARVPFHVTALGKVMAAFNLNEEFINRIRSYNFVKFNENSITDFDSFMKVLHKTKEQGYGEDLEENEIGLVCYAVPVIDIHGDAIAALSISGPSYRMFSNKDKLIESLKKTSKEVSQALGYNAKIMNL